MTTCLIVFTMRLGVCRLMEIHHDNSTYPESFEKTPEMRDALVLNFFAQLALTVAVLFSRFCSPSSPNVSPGPSTATGHSFTNTTT